MRDDLRPKEIAVVGIGCRFPGGVQTPAEFWRLLCDGLDAITEIPRDRFEIDALFDVDPARPGAIYTRWGGFLDAIDRFDADFFGIAPREARRIDPQHRLLLEVAWEALEDGGLVPEQLAGTKTGVFVGISTHDYSDVQGGPRFRDLIDAHTNIGAGACIAANRISYLFDLRGPSLAVDTACSSSLTAVHLACQSLVSGESDLAIAAGVNVLLSPEPTIGFCKATMLSPDGRCRSFDADANGYVRGEGAGAVVLKPLARAMVDHDPIYAVIRGTAVNQDGRTPGMSVPSAAAQEEMLRHALHEAALSPSAIQYVEAHGTGTKVGDPIEATALGRALTAGRPIDRPCLIGSVKSNIGHLEAAAGIVGLIKAALILKHRQIPPTIHFRTPNPAIPFDDLRLRVPTAMEPWPAGEGPAVTGVNSFGFGGTNAHAILQEPPPLPENLQPADLPGPHILTISARSEQALKQSAERYRQRLSAEPHSLLSDVCSTAAVYRTHHEHRLAAVANTHDEVKALLDAYLAGEERVGLVTGRCLKQREPKLAFVFPGMGPQWWGMGRQLLAAEPVFTQILEECDQLLRPIAGWSLLAELSAGEAESRIGEPYLAHVANFAIQVALATLWRSWGIVPDAVVGHSSGEMAAACVAGALSLPEGLHLAYHRGRLQQRTAGSGTMLAVGLPPDAATRLIAGLDDLVSIAAINSPTAVTLSGATAALEQIVADLERQGHFSRFLPVTVPYHGPQMEPIRDELLAVLGDLRPTAATIPIVSEVMGRWADDGAFGAGYWWQNVREPVQFAGAVEQLIDAGCEIFVEVGPHPVLAGSIAECLAHHDRTGLVLPSLRRGEDEERVLRGSLAALHVCGRRVNWPAVYPNGNRVPLPPYPWQRERHWFESPPDATDAPPQPVGRDSGHPLLGRRLPLPHPVWQGTLRDPRLAYLREHTVQGAAIVPGASYVEMALAAAAALRPGETQVVEQIELRRLLFLDEERPVTLQLLYDPRESLVEIHSAPPGEDQEWTLHATAKIGQPVAGDAPALDLEAIARRCPTTLPAANYYASLDRHGYRFGATFRAIAELQVGEAEAIGRVCLTAEAAAAAASYRVHPALLDASFQVLVAAAGWTPSGDIQVAGTYVPVALDRVVFDHLPGGDCRVHAVVTRREGAEIQGNAWLVDEIGAVALRYDGLRLRALDDRQVTPDASIDDLLYRFVWEESPLVDEPQSGDRQLPMPVLRERIQPALNRMSVAWQQHRYDETVEPALNALALRATADALHRLGWDRDWATGQSADELAATLGVVPGHRRLFARLLDLATTEPGPPEIDVEAIAAASPGFHAEFVLVRRCTENLTELLLGKKDAREILFTDESLDLLSAIYRDSPAARFYSGMVAEIAAIVIDALPASGRLRILEVGAGTGGTTAALLSRLPGGRFDYLVTDLSPFFLNRARERFRGEAALRFATLDVELDPIAQHLPENGFDLIVAANVVHATADVRTTLGHLRRLLAPGGLLILQEATRQSPWLDVTFGLLDGWWRFADHDLRPAHPLLTAAQWQSVPAASGFADAIAIGDPAGGGETQQAVILAQAPDDGPPRSEPQHGGVRSKHWLILADRRGVADTVAAEVRARGDNATLVSAGVAYCRLDDGRFEISPLDAEDMTRLLADVRATGVAFEGIIHAWNLDAPRSEVTTTTDLLAWQRIGCGVVLRALKAFQEQAEAIPAIWLVTSGAQAIEPRGETSLSVAQAPLLGMGRVLINEHADVGCRLVDLGEDPTPEEIGGLVRELYAGDGEEEIALRGRQRFVKRLVRATGTDAAEPVATMALSPDRAVFRLEIGAAGALETLALRERPPAALEPGEVAIRVVAAGLTFRDVLMALGVLTPMAVGGGAADVAFGLECGGIVVACGEGVTGLTPGDEVVALAQGVFGSHAIAPAALVVPKPPALTFEEAACIPSAFLTAHYALDHLARLGPGERVLIHAATGGVGLAAIQFAQLAGAATFATAGSPEKRAFLTSLGVDHVMDSRSLAWADEIRDLTGGEGVDVVLNSIAGEAIRRGLASLRPFGRFVEIGKRDIAQDSAVGLAPFANNLSFFSLDLIRLGIERPGLVGAMLRDVTQRLADGTLNALPHTDFDLADAERAFRLMAQAKHIGKVVLTVRQPEYPVAVSQARSIVRPDATYLITGGLGGFGVEVARWLVDQGCRHVVLMSRSGVPKEGDAGLAALQATPAHIVVVQGDVAREGDVARALDFIRGTMPPLKGVFHAAMVLDDDLLVRLDDERLLGVLAPKIAGAWHLHRLTAADDLDAFVLFSSVASSLGHPSQGNYAAANAFLDALAPYRRGRGLPAVAVNWGVLKDTGFVSRHEHLRQYADRMGFGGMAPAEAVRVLDRVLRHGTGDVVAARIDWRTWLQQGHGSGASRQLGRFADQQAESPARLPERASASLLAKLRSAPAGERRELLEQHIAGRVARVLGAAEDRIDRDRPLTEMGFDSLMAVELQTALKSDPGAHLSVVQLLLGVSVRELTAEVLTQLAFDSTSPSPAPVLRPAPVHGAAQHPVASEQRRFWLLDRLQPGNPAYNLYAAIRLSGRLDLAALEWAVGEVVRRHEVLRAVFTSVDGEPVQTFSPAGIIDLTPVDLGDLPVTEREAAFQRSATAEVQRPFDLGKGPLFRVNLFRLAADEHVFLLTVHHIVFDAWSGGVFSREVAALYQARAAGKPSPLPALPVRYVDVVREQQHSLTDDLLATQIDYWRRQLTGVPSQVRLPADRPRPQSPTFRGGHHRFELSAELTAALAELSRREGVTPFMLLLAAFQTLLHRYSGENDICVGTPVVTRGLPGAGALIGCLMNTLVMRTDLGGDPSFRQLLRRVRQVALDAYAHQDLPFERVVQTVQPSREGTINPIFQAMLVFHNTPPSSLAAPGMTLSLLPIESELAMLDLLLMIEPGERLHGTLEYNADLFDAATAGRIVSHLQTLLGGIAADPDRTLSSLPILPDAERHHLLLELNDTAVDYPEPRCLHELVEAQVARTPDAIAVVAGEERLTFRELDRRANRLAHRLRQLGVGPEVLVAVCAERSPALVVALLGVLKAGGAFVPLDPANPPARLGLILEDVEPTVLLTQRHLSATLPAPGIPVVLLDGEDDPTTEDEDDPPVVVVRPDHLAYVLYTSGSTGQPKGVMIAHRAICSQVRWRQQAFPLAETDAVLQRIPLGFDPAIWEIFGPLAAGARLILARPDGGNDPAHLTSQIVEHGVTTLQAVPSTLEVLLDYPEFGECRSLKRVFCGGEVLTSALQERFFARTTADLVNLYGPTEATIDAAWWTCRRDDDAPLVPIGRPIANVQLSILDAHGQPVPIGVPGELCIGGAGVARGYLRQSALTAERFVTLPHLASPDDRAYRTGDLARFRSDGAIEFLGRLDRQVKVHGVRVEPGEIEAVLAAHPSVRQAAVVAYGDAAEPRLAAYVVPRADRLRAAELRQFVGARLPWAMVPAHVELLDSLPVLVSGKVDYQSLPLPDANNRTPRGSTVAPRDAIEARLTHLWEHLFESRPIGVTDDFFALGGHSLMAARLVADVHREFGRELPLSALFQGPTIEALAKLLRQQANPLPHASLVAIQPEGTKLPFFVVHPIGGSVYCYVELARRLGDDQPFYGLQATGLDAGQDASGDVEAMATSYVDALSAVQPDGPYRLGGWSMGAVVAHAMARQLQARGDEVSLLALLDPPDVLPDGFGTDGGPVAQEPIRDFIEHLGLKVEDVTEAIDWDWRSEEQLVGVLDVARSANLLPPNTDIVHMERLFGVYVAHTRAMRECVPRPYAGRIVLFRASERRGRSIPDAMGGWTTFATGGVSLVEVAGDHFTMLREPHVDQLAQLLLANLDDGR